MKFLFFYVFRKVDEVKKIIAGNVLSNLHQSDHDENILITVIFKVCVGRNGQKVLKFG